MSYTLRIHVANHQVERLKQKGYKLCIAKEVNGTYTVIWHADEYFFPRSTYKWPVNDTGYKIYAQQCFETGEIGEPVTDPVDIAFNQIAKMGTWGIIYPPANDGATDTGGHSFTLENEYEGPIAFGISQPIQSKYQSPICAFPGKPGALSFSPKNNVKLWFAPAETEAGQIINGAPPEAFEVNFSSDLTRSVVYTSEGPNDEGRWSMAQ